MRSTSVHIHPRVDGIQTWLVVDVFLVGVFCFGCFRFAFDDLFATPSAAFLCIVVGGYDICHLFNMQFRTWQFGIKSSVWS